MPKKQNDEETKAGYDDADRELAKQMARKAKFEH